MSSANDGLSLSRRNDMKDIVLIITDKVYLTDY